MRATAYSLPKSSAKHLAVSAFLFAGLVPLGATAQPAAPAGLLATAGDEQAILTWQDPSNSNIVRYEFRFGAGEAPEFNAWAEVPGGGADTVEHTVSGLVNGTRYAFELRAADGAGAGEAASAATRLAVLPSSIVDVPDASLREQIKRNLGLAGDATITQGDLAKLREFRAVANHIADLEGLEFAMNLVSLSLRHNKIAGVSPLADLRRLTKLFLSGNEIADISPLSSLTSLTHLDLFGNRITDISPLSGLTSLTWLHLHNNEIEDISPLLRLRRLTTLAAQNNNIADVALSGLTLLTYLDLSGNEIADISLSGLTSLTQLHLSRNELASVTLSDLTSLPYLDMPRQQIVDISLSNLPSLTHLYLLGNEIAHVSLSGLSSLTYLDLSSNKMADVSPLFELVSLKALYLPGNEIADILPLSRLRQLETLSLRYNEIADISPLSGLTSLVYLHLSGNEIADISPLAGLTLLIDLDLPGNEIADISPLAGLTRLRGLDLSGNEIAGISPLSRKPKLTNLNLSNNEITDISPLASPLAAGCGPPCTRLTKLNLSDNEIVDISPLLESGLLKWNPGTEKYLDLRGNSLSNGQDDHVVTLRESGTAVVFDDGGKRVPLFPSAASWAIGFVRVINHSDISGTVSVEAVDERGDRRGPESLTIHAGQALHFNAGDLEQGNPVKGLRGVGEAVGDWRLVLRSELDIEVLGYARTPDGFVTSLHDLAPRVETAFGDSVVPIFNPGSNLRQVSRLRLINPTGWDRQASVWAQDDTGDGSWSEPMTPARRTLDLTAAQLESGSAEARRGVDLLGNVAREAGRYRAATHNDGIPDFDGIGDGAGKWRLNIRAPGQRVMSLLRSPTGHLANISTGTAASVPHWGEYWARGGRYRVPLFLTATNDIQGFLRIVNQSQGSATIELRVFDGLGVERDPVVLTLKGGHALHFNSEDLELGNAAKGLPGFGAPTGDWHLEVSADRRFEVLAYARTADGFVTSMHDVAPRLEDGSLWIPFFNPGRNPNQISRLRLVNWGETAAEATIEGVDDAGNSPGEAVRVTLPARSARDYTARELETGEGAGLSGALGEGTGKWRLRVSSAGDIEAMSLLGLPTGHITNLSTTPRLPPN